MKRWWFVVVIRVLMLGRLALGFRPAAAARLCLGLLLHGSSFSYLNH
jgi:hypothetical protein